jgi:hypothetical protein
LSKFYNDKITNLNKFKIKQQQLADREARLPAGGVAKGNKAIIGKPYKPPRERGNTSSHVYIGMDLIPTKNSDSGTHRLSSNGVTGPGYYLSSQSYDGYENKAIASIDAIFRPFVTETEVAISSFPHFESPDSDATIPHVGTLNPYGGNHDIMVVAKNFDITTASGDVDVFFNEHLLDVSEVAPTSVKSIALKGPLVVAGWGYNIDGNPVPANPDDSSEFMEDHRKRMDQWKCGPVDLRWDDSRKVWAAGGGNNIIFGRCVNNLYANSSGLIDIFDLASGYPFDVYVGVSGEGRVYAYDMLLQDNTMHYANTTVALTKIGNRYFILNAGCSSC